MSLLMLAVNNAYNISLRYYC